MRELVTLRKIDKLVPMIGYDNIELAIIDGWTVIVKKGSFSEGDSCYYFEIDSFIPATDVRFNFLGKVITHQNIDGYRLKTKKLRQYISQGLALPVHMFPELNHVNHKRLAQALNIIKYEADIINFNIGSKTRTFPNFIPKTDQERIQNLPQYFELFKDVEFEETLKLNGTSLTVYKQSIPIIQRIKNIFKFKFKNYRVGVCSRNNELFDKKSMYWFVVKDKKIDRKLPKNYAIQAELIGEKIQGNYEKINGIDYYVFDVYDIKAKQYLSPEKRKDFCQKYNLQHIPVLSEKIKACSLTIQELLERVEGESMNNDVVSEGRVYKAYHKGQYLTFKVISNSYLVNHEN